MTIPRNSKLWLRDLPGKLWIIDEIKALMTQYGVPHSYSLKSNEDVHCLYIYEQTYTFGTSPTNHIGSPFYKADGKLIHLVDLFPTPEPGRKVAIKVRSEAHSKAIQDILFELGYGWASSGKTYAGFKDPVLVITPEHKRITCAHAITGYTEIYYSQLLNIKHNGEQVKVQGTHQPEPGCTGSSAGRLQSRHCKITTGRRYTGHPVSYFRSRPKVRESTISGSVCKPGYSNSSYGTQGLEGGFTGAGKIERDLVLEKVKTYYKTGI